MLSLLALGSIEETFYLQIRSLLRVKQSFSLPFYLIKQSVGEIPQVVVYDLGYRVTDFAALISIRGLFSKYIYIQSQSCAYYINYNNALPYLLLTNKILLVLLLFSMPT